MKNFVKIAAWAAMGLMTCTGSVDAQTKQDWGDFKLWIDPGHSGRENQGMYGYSEAQKVLRVGLATRDYLMNYTTADANTIRMTRDDDQDNVSLDERSDMANAWGADFFYSIHSDAGSNNNETLFLFGGWYENGTPVEKTPNGGKKMAEILDPNLTGVMYNTTSRGSWYDRYYYDRVTDHYYHFPYLSVNRRTNMASMLSEGGFHTLPMQQALNINDDYKRLEAFATARSIMEYRAIARPDLTMLTGIVTNSENGQPINGVTVTVDGKTYTTDTYESTFSKWVKNPDLVHNGFFLFEGLTPGQEYEVTYACQGFSPASQKVTIKSDPQGLSGNNVTWANIQMINNMPAIVSSVNIEDVNNVPTTKDILITFSRNMDTTSVENAFSINNAGQAALSWDNKYTLRMKTNALMNDMDYTVTIDGAIAKNSQTAQLLDGDKDGVEGGNYVFSFKTAPEDVEAPYVISTTPAADSTMLYTLRPAIRVEFNEIINFNEDNDQDAITVEDAAGNLVEGKLTNEIVNDATVLHLYPNADLARDKAYKVTVKGGFTDLSGNVSTTKVFKFLSEYRTVVDEIQVDDMSVGHFWGPDGSGSTYGTTSKLGTGDAGDSYVAQSTLTSSQDITKSLRLHYKFDPDAPAGYWQIREYRSANQNDYSLGTNRNGYILQTYIYGDGSNHMIGHMVRLQGDGLKYHKIKRIGFKGWDMLAWQVNPSDTNSIASFTGNLVEISETTNWCFDSFFIRHTSTDDLDEEDDTPRETWEADVWFDDFKLVKYGTEAQTAKLSDIQDEVTGVNDVTTSKKVASVTYYNVAGMNSEKPFDGINIVVTTYSDGSKRTTKTIK